MNIFFCLFPRHFGSDITLVWPLVDNECIVYWMWTTVLNDPQNICERDTSIIYKQRIITLMISHLTY